MFRDLFRFVGGTIRLVFFLAGVLVLLVGIFLSLSVIGALIGLPLIVLGIFLIGFGALFAPKSRVRTVRHVHIHDGVRQEPRPKNNRSTKGGKVVDVKGGRVE